MKSVGGLVLHTLGSYMDLGVVGTTPKTAKCLHVPVSVPAFPGYWHCVYCYLVWLTGERTKVPACCKPFSTSKDVAYRFLWTLIHNITELKGYEFCRSVVISKGNILQKAGRFLPSREPHLLFYVLSPCMNSLWSWTRKTWLMLPQ